MRTAQPEKEEIEQRVERWRAENPGKKPIRLDASVSGQPMRGVPLAAMQAAVAQLGCKGTFPGEAPAGGSMELRGMAAAGQARNGVSLAADEVFVFPGARSALQALLGLVAPGASVLLPSLCEPWYEQAVRLAGHSALRATAGENREFLPLPEGGPLPENTPQVDMILLAHPSPVSGMAYSVEQLARWVEYTAKTGALLIVDTTYAAFMPEAEKNVVPRGILHSAAARGCAVELRGLSAMEGFCVTPCALVYAARELAPGGTALHGPLSERTACMDGIAHPVSRAAAALLAASNGGLALSWSENAAFLSAALAELGAHFFGGQDAPFLWVQCPAGYEGASRRFFEALLQECGVVCMPGEAYGEAGEGWFRLSALCDKAAAEIALKRITQQFQFE